MTVCHPKTLVLKQYLPGGTFRISKAPSGDTTAAVVEAASDRRTGRISIAGTTSSGQSPTALLTRPPMVRTWNSSLSSTIM